MLILGLVLRLFAEPDIESKQEKTQDKTQMKPSIDERTLEETLVIGSLAKDSTRLSKVLAEQFKTAGAVNDPLRSIFALPGVIQPSGWRFFGPVVHGSAPQDNNYFINGVPTQYLYHLYGSSVIPSVVLKIFY